MLRGPGTECLLVSKLLVPGRSAYWSVFNTFTLLISHGLTSPLTAGVCFILALIFEPNAFGTPSMGWGRLLGFILVCSVFVLAKMALDLKLIQITSAFTFSIAGVVHNLLIILSGVAFLGDELEPLEWGGFALICSGVLLHTALKAKSGGGGSAH